MASIRCPSLWDWLQPFPNDHCSSQGDLMEMTPSFLWFQKFLPSLAPVPLLPPQAPELFS